MEYIPLAVSVSLPVIAIVFNISSNAGALGSFLSINADIIVVISVTDIVRNIGDNSPPLSLDILSAYCSIFLEFNLPLLTNSSHIALPCSVASLPNI